MPVWPTCFCTAWPMPAEPNRLPSARTARIASAARSTVSLSGCLPNLVMWIPRIQTSPLALMACSLSSLRRLEPEVDGFRAGRVETHRVDGQPNLHAQLHVLRIGRGVDDVPAHAGAGTVDDRGDEGHLHPRRGEGHDRERPHHPFGRNVDFVEVGSRAGGTGVAAVEEPGTTGGTAVGDQVRFT